MVIVTTAHQKPSGMDLKCELADPASAKYTVLENRTTPKNNQVFKQKLTFGEKIKGPTKICITYIICYGHLTFEKIRILMVLLL